MIAEPKRQYFMSIQWKWAIICLFGLFLLVSSLSAQDLHFSQFYMQPLYANAGLGGDYEGDIRLAVINRRQWGQLGVPINSSGASLEKKVRVVNDFLIIGGQFINDRVSTTGLVTNKAYFSSTYQRAISRHILHFGAQIGYVTTKIDPDHTFPSQFNSATGSFDSGMSNGESLGDNRDYMDINVGFLWNTLYMERFRFKTGVSVAHINVPNESYSISEVSRLPMRFLVHHSIEARVNNDWSVIPQAQLAYTGRAKQLLSILRLKRHISQNISMYGGVGYRGYAIQNDAILTIFGLTYHYLDVGISYDWNVSQLSSNSNLKTSLEFSVILRTPPRKYKPVLHRRNKPCPVYVSPT